MSEGSSAGEPAVQDACLGDHELAEILEGRVTEPHLARAHDHAAACDGCRALLAHAGRVRAAERTAEVGGSPSEVTEVGEWLVELESVRPPAEKIGRFVVLHRLGEGGMGVVVAARDEQLNRKVAIKLLRDRGRRETERGRARLLREARAMARVEHPNVLAVHEVGVHDDRVFLVMDFVDGSDLLVWLRAQPRSWRELVDAWISAGEGLAAVHAHGLVHRDFKPQNVLVRKDGRVQVTDFGLVGAAAQLDDEVDPDELDAVMGQERTAAGKMVGTPRYMAPEQLDGDAVTPATDQFAFCVSLWEALTQRHPFEQVGGDRSHAQRHAQIVAAPRSGGVPTRVLAVLRRGLARSPEDRHPSMVELLRALRGARDAPQRRRRAVLAMVVIGAAVVAGAWLRPLASRDELCAPPPGGDFAGLWDEARRERVLAQRRAVDTSDVVARIERGLDDYRARWSELRRDACEATRVRGEVSLELLDRRMACLHARKAAFSTTVELLEHDPLGERHSDPLALVYGLPPSSPCGDLQGMAAAAERPRDPATAQAVLELEAELAAASVLWNHGRAAAARAKIEPTLAAAERIGWAPLLARALVAAARLERAGDPLAALDTWRRAYVVAMRADPGTGFEAAIDGVDAYVRVQDLEHAELFADVAQAQAELLGGEPHPGDLANNRALLAGLRDDLPEAERQLRAAIAAVEADPERRPALMHYHMNLVAVLASQGQLDEARTAADMALALTTELYGDDHPSTLRTRTNAANVDFAAGDVERAARTAAQVASQWRGLEHPVEEAVSLDLHARATTFPECLAPAERALQLRRAALAPRDPLIAKSLGVLAECLLEGGRVEEALRSFDEAIERLGGDDSAQRAELEALRAQARARAPALPR